MYSVGTIEVKRMIADQTASLMKEIFLEKVGEGEVEKSFRTKLLKNVGPQTYISWFDRGKVRVQDAEIVFESMSGFAKHWIENNHCSSILETIAEHLGFKLQLVSPGTLGKMGAS